MYKNLKIYLSVILAVVLIAVCLLVGQSNLQADSTAYVDLSDVKQAIRGFGGSTAWHSPLTDVEANSLFTTIGLSLLRVRIDPGSDDPYGSWSDELSNAQKAVARGANVFASSWSPPASMKDNGSLIGGSLLAEEYANYADWLASFGNYMESNGISLYAISVQNEPNISVDYESCEWTAEQMRDFIKNHGSAIGYPVMMPETFNYLPTWADVILNDPTACANTSIVAHHWYGANRHQYYTNAFEKGKEVWMTEEYSDDQTRKAALATAKDIHNFMTINYDSAYAWWYVREPSCNLIQSGGAINPRGYAIGQFAKFVRPGYNRVGTTDPSVKVLVSAYKGTKVVIVAINTGKSAVDQPFMIQNGTVTSVTPYVTSVGGKNMEAGSPIDVVDGSFIATLDAESVTTFVEN